MDFLNRILNDELRAMIIAFFPDIFTALQLFGVDLTGDQAAIVMSIMMKAVVLFFWIFKAGQNQGEGGKAIFPTRKKS